MTPSDDGVEPDADLDPDVLEELEFWGTGADEPDEVVAADEGDGAEEVDEENDADRGYGDPGHRPALDPIGASAGAVVLVGTPIGNLGDLSPRAVRTLEEADVIYCEDTRHSRKLLTHAGITGATLRSLHEHNEHDRLDEIVAAVSGGRTVAIVSDAGMPGVSDPGSRVVAAAARAGLAVTVVPGPSAVLAALVASGLATDRFVFEGFLPRSGKERKVRVAALAGEPRTTVLFEAPRRVAATLADLADACGPARRVAVARELTKVHEEIWRGSLADAAAWAATAPLRGEVVLVVEGAPDQVEEPVGDDILVAALTERLTAGERTRGAVDEVAAVFAVPRRRVYDLALTAQGRAAPADPPAEGPPPVPGAE